MNDILGLAIAFAEGPLAAALALLPSSMNSPEARVLVTAICLQESKLKDRWQIVDARHPERKGPARGVAQFEQGTSQSKGGVWGVFIHEASRYWVRQLCAALNVPAQPSAIWREMERNDVLAAGMARLLLFTNHARLPSLESPTGAFAYYLATWRPGAYTRGDKAEREALMEKWRVYYAIAMEAAS